MQKEAIVFYFKLLLQNSSGSIEERKKYVRIARLRVRIWPQDMPNSKQGYWLLGLDFRFQE